MLEPLSGLSARYRQIATTAYAEAERAARRRIEAEYTELGGHMFQRLREGYLMSDVIRASGLSAPTVYKYIEDYVRTLGGGDEMVQRAIAASPKISHWKLGNYEESRQMIRAIHLAEPDAPWYIETRDPRIGPYLLHWDDNRQLRQNNKTMPDDIGDLVQEAQKMYAETVF